MDEKKQNGTQPSDNKGLNTSEENQNNNKAESKTPEVISESVEQEPSDSQEVNTSGQKSGSNKKVIGAAVVVVAAVVGGAVYMTQQSQTDGMWSNGSRAVPLEQEQSSAPVAVPETTQKEAQPESVTNETEAPAESDADSAKESTTEPAVSEENRSTVTSDNGLESEAINAVSIETEADKAGADTAEADASVAGDAVPALTDHGDHSTVQLSAESAGNESAGNESGAVNSVKEQLDQQTGQLNQLKAELQQIQEQYTELLAQRVSRADVDVSLFVVNDVARLVQSADNELSIAGNLPNAVRALEMAQQTIRRADSPILSGLAGAVSSDIVMLKSAPVMNEDSLFNEVGKLMVLLDKAPLLSPDQVAHLSTVLPNNTISQSGEPEVQVTASQDLSWYEKAWEEIKSWPSQTMGMLKSDLGGLVRVEKLNDPTVALVSVGQAAALKNNLKLDLRFAQQGLLNAQQGIWTSSLESVQAALLKYYNQDAPETRNALEQTRNLLTIPVRPQLPQITHSIKAIEETRNQIVNLGKPQE